MREKMRNRTGQRGDSGVDDKTKEAEVVAPHGSDATILDALSTTCMVCRPGGEKRAAGG